MKSIFKNLILMVSILLEAVGFMLVLMQYKIISEDIVILVSGIVTSFLIIYGITLFFRTLIHKDDKQPPHYTIKRREIFFWVLLMCSLIMMVIVNILIYAGYNYNSVGFLVPGAIWVASFFISGLMYLFDFVIIDDVERQRKERLNQIREQFTKGGEEE